MAKLTPLELRIFARLERSRGRWLSSRDLAESAIGWPSTGLRSHICRMRRKLTDTNWDIETRPGYGYRIRVKVDTAA